LHFNTLGLKMTDKIINLNDSELEHTLETVFFALSRPLRVSELAIILDKEERVIRSYIKKIRRKFIKGNYSFKLDKIATDVYMMGIEENLELPLKKILQGEKVYRFSNDEIKVLTNVAYHQPVRKSDLLNMIENIPKNRITSTLHELQVKDYTMESLEKKAIILRTTTKFALEFGFSTELRKLKQQLHWRLRRNS